MLRKKEERNIETRTAMREGPGSVILTSIANKEELFNKGRMFSTITLNPGCGIGKHEHKSESEIFYIVTGEADYIDDDNLYKVHAGDVTICEPNHYHGITNNSNKVCEFVALIVME